MMNISPANQNALKLLFPDRYEELIAEDDIIDILDALDDLYLDLLNDQQEPTEQSRKCEELRDRIHWEHFHSA